MASIPNKNVLNGTTNPTTSQFKNEMSNLWEYINAPEFPEDVKLTGLGKRIISDFSNATLTNRTMFQTSTTNGSTAISAIPNGTGTSSSVKLYSKVDVLNSETLNLSVTSASTANISADKNGTGTYLPLTFNVGGSEKVRVDTNGNVLVVSAGGGIGYGTGSGGTVTQPTSKSTSVTLNKPCGQITMNNASLAAGARATFVVYNSLVSVNDVVHVCLSGGSSVPDDYRLRVRVAAGAFAVSVTNENAGALAEAVVINFAIIKGATT